MKFKQEKISLPRYNYSYILIHLKNTFSNLFLNVFDIIYYVQLYNLYNFYLIFYHKHLPCHTILGGKYLRVG